MRIALYGLPCAGKTTLLAQLTEIKTVSGSEELKRLCKGNFSDLSDSEQTAARVKYTEYLRSLDNEIVLSDGHFSFLDEVVFTDADADVYDVFLYLYCNPEVLSERYQNSPKNERYRKLPTTRIANWQSNEIEQLREECHKRNRDFYVLKSEGLTPKMLLDFIGEIKNGYSSFGVAERIVAGVKEKFPQVCKINIVDGDKTLVKEDLFGFCSNRTTHTFDGGFYTGYQSLCFAEETKDVQFDCGKLSEVNLNSEVFDRIKGEGYIVLSSGIAELWEQLGALLGIKNIFASPLISADTKFFVVKLLRECGYTVTAFGDSKIDLYMLRAANEGFLYLGERMSRSLYNVDVSGINLIYSREPIVLADIDDSLTEAIELTKSDSGVNGGRLAAAHFRLGEKLGAAIGKAFPAIKTAVVVMERGGRFFGDGLYSAFGGVLYPYNPAKDSFPDVSRHEIVIIADSVINTASSVLSVIAQIKTQNPRAEIIVAANVVQQNALAKLSGYKLFAVRVSGNFFVGRKQAVQTGETGPDTADRLFNLIDS